MIMKWSQNDPISNNFFDAFLKILVVNSYIYAYHCNVCRDWQSIEWGTINRMKKILREWKRFDGVQDSIYTWVTMESKAIVGILHI